MRDEDFRDGPQGPMGDELGHPDAPYEPDPMSPQAMRRVEAYGNGAALGGGSRLGAGLQAVMARLLPKSWGGGGDMGTTYNQALRENRQILDQGRAAEPVLSKALEIGGSIPTTIALAGRGNKVGLVPKVINGMKAGAGLTGIGSMLASRGDLGSEESAWDTGTGLVSGALAGGTAPLIVHGAGALANGLLNRTAGDSLPGSQLSNSVRRVLERVRAPYAEATVDATRPPGSPSGEEVSAKADALMKGNQPAFEKEMAKTEAEKAYEQAMRDDARRRALVATGNEPTQPAAAMVDNTAAARPRSLMDTAPAKTRFEGLRSLLEEETQN